MVEHTTENRGVGGSIPPLATTPSAAGAGEASDDALASSVARRLDLVGLVSNAFGAVIVAGFLAFLFPNTVSDADYERLIDISTPVFAVYMVLALFLGRTWSARRARPIMSWLRSGREASESERAAVLRYPLDFALIVAVFWVTPAALFWTIWLDAGLVAADGILMTSLLGGLTACGLQYLLVERTMRPVAARALAGGPPPRLAVPGVATRLTMAWLLATAVPVLGIVGFAVADLSGADLDRDQLILASLFLAVVALTAGLMAILLAARSVADPVSEVQEALERVQAGDFETRVDVDDGSEVGMLQAGFNRMVAGLQERERMRDLFGRHVGRDVASKALEKEVELGGEVREVAALFVDLVGSTTLAARRPPAEVVELLNEFFRVVVEATERQGGLVNKFQGDAALCIFGAPTETEDPAGSALAAAREIRDRARNLPQVDIGVGVSAGEAVAGNVGAEQRFEYTVIGDPVNEAARLCELAKQKPERLLASEAALRRASAAESSRWALGESVTLRGRDEPTRLATALSGS